MNEFEEDYKKLQSPLYVLPPASPKKNGALKEVTKLLERNSMKVLNYWLILLVL
jgi:hypothetical protein